MVEALVVNGFGWEDIEEVEEVDIFDSGSGGDFGKKFL